MSKIFTWIAGSTVTLITLGNLKNMFNQNWVDNKEKELLQNSYNIYDIYHNQQALNNIHKWRKSNWISRTFTLPKFD